MEEKEKQSYTCVLALMSGNTNVERWSFPFVDLFQVHSFLP